MEPVMKPSDAFAKMTRCDVAARADGRSRRAQDDCFPKRQVCRILKTNKLISLSPGTTLMLLGKDGRK
jgi:hypothetical protein